MTTLQDEIRDLLRTAATPGPGRSEALDGLSKLLGQAGAMAAVVGEGERAATALSVLLSHTSKVARKRAAEALSKIGPDAIVAAPQLAAAASGSDAGLRRAALVAIASVGGPQAIYERAVLAGLKRGDEAVIPIVAGWGAAALPLVRPLLGKGGKGQRAAVEALALIAEHIDGDEIEDDLDRGLLESDKEPLQVAALKVVSGLRKPPEGLLESVADVSSLRGAKRAMLRFDEGLVKRELRSLIKSRSTEECLVGLGIVQRYGASAAEFAPQIAALLAVDVREATAVACVNALGKLLDGAALTEALEPALDHWSDKVQEVGRFYLTEAEIPIRDSIWEGNPFSEALLRQLQRLGFKPTGPFEIPTARPLPERAIEWAGKGIGLEETTLSPTVWALLNLLSTPPYQLYTVWGSDENTDTFYFHTEPPIYEAPIRGNRHLMHVIGDGSIGYFATIDLRDTSNDPMVYYIERWEGWGDHYGWQASWSLSSYLKRLGVRSVGR